MGKRSVVDRLREKREKDSQLRHEMWAKGKPGVARDEEVSIQGQPGILPPDPTKAELVAYLQHLLSIGGAIGPPPILLNALTGRKRK